MEIDAKAKPFDFVSDFIKPGEFSFCPRCGSGNSCQLGGKAEICIDCGPLDICHKDELDEKIFMIKKKAQKNCGRIMYLARREIARMRREKGLKARFWMDKR